MTHVVARGQLLDDAQTGSWTGDTESPSSGHGEITLVKSKRAFHLMNGPFLRIGKDLAISRHDVWASAFPWAFEWAGYALPEQGGL